MALSLPVASHEPHFVPTAERRRSKNIVTEIVPGTAGAEAGFVIGDRVLTVNDEPLRDIVDWKFNVAGESATITFERDGELRPRTVTLSKGYDEDLGLRFADDLFDSIHICKNKCVFCFLYQQPKGLRPSLYIKDDDFRLSFLHGNYVTLTNLKPGELDRICAQKLSPMYVSIHATDPETRGKMLGRRQAEPILPILQRLADARIQFHGQVVLCPGYNDGDALTQTITELAALHPEARGGYGGILSLAVVPVGITQFRERLAPVTVVSPGYAGQLLDYAETYRETYRKTLGTRFVYLSDEFYLSAKRPIPTRAEYEGFPQLEDGIGLVRLFLDDLAKLEKRLPVRIPTPRTFTLITGEAASHLVNALADLLNRVENVSVNVCTIANAFFKGNINIAGLIVGGDIVDALADFPVGDTVIIPSVMLRDGENVFLDEMTLDTLSERLGKPVLSVERTPTAAAEAVLS